jgi:hypothetical protein
MEIKAVKLGTDWRDYALLAWVIFICIVCCAIIYFFVPLPLVGRIIFVVSAVIAFSLFLGVGYLMTTMINAKVEQVGLTFRYTSKKGELVFPKNNAIYRPENYKKLIFGCVRGWDMRRFHRGIGGMWVSKAKKRYTGYNTQHFMLVLDKDDKWKRYDIASEYVVWDKGQAGSQMFIELVDQLRPHLDFDVFVKDYSQDECFEQQNR